MSDDPEIRRGGVVVVDLDPAEGHEMKKTRPAVVVQNDVGNENSGTTIVAPATGTYRGDPFEILVEAPDSPFEKDSSVGLDQIRVVSIDDRIRSVVGRLDTISRLGWPLASHLPRRERRSFPLVS